LRQAAASVLRSSWLWGAAIAVFAWPAEPIAARFENEQSGWLALHMATHAGYDFGTEVAWTYGPLGFLHFPIFESGPLFALSALYVAVLRGGLAILLVHALRRIVAWPIAVAVAFVVASYVAFDAELPAMAALAIVVLGSRPDELVRRAYPVMAGVIAGIELLVKFNHGATSVLLGLTVVLATRRDGRWRVPAFAGVGLVVATIGWLATRQGDPVDFVLNGIAISNAYAAGMLLETKDIGWEYWAAPISVAILIVLARGVRLRDAPRWGLWLVLAITLYFGWKEGFVRDTGHTTAYFETTLVLGAVLVGYQALPRRRLELSAVAMAALAVMSFGAIGISPAVRMKPKEHLDVFRDTVGTVVSGDHRARLWKRSREAIRAAAPMPPAVADELRGRTVNVLPHQQSFIWAYDLKWRPTGILQPYGSLAGRIDRLNATRFAARDAPERILVFQEGTLDGRFPGWDSPTGTLAMLCRYRLLVAQNPWFVLGRGPDRCGRPRRLARVESAYGKRVAVPRPSRGMAETVTIDGVWPHGLERLRMLAFRPYERRVVFDGGRNYRLVPGVAENPALVASPPDLTNAVPDLSPQARSLAVHREGHGGKVTFTFYEVPIRR
jgi:hypothetical protein